MLAPNIPLSSVAVRAICVLPKCHPPENHVTATVLTVKHAKACLAGRLDRMRVAHVTPCHGLRRSARRFVEYTSTFARIQDCVVI